MGLGRLEWGHGTGRALRLLRWGLLILGSAITAAASPALAGQSSSRAPRGQEALQTAVLLVQQGRFAEADRAARPALADPATRAAANSVLGAIRLQQQRLDESASFLREALRLDPTLLGAHLTLAEVQTLQGQHELAVASYKRALQLDSMNPAARFGLARAETARGNDQASLEIARPVLGAFKLFAEGLSVLATNYLKTGDRAAALELVPHWARLPDIPQTWTIKFALLYAGAGVAPGAVAILEDARKTTARTFELEFNLAGAYLMNGDPARALEAYDLALGLRPDSLPALQQAAGVAERQGELERSLSYWMRAKKLAPEDPAILLGFGRVCLRMDLLEDAEPALTKAASLKPGEITYQYTLAAAKVGKRQYEAAQHLLEPLLRQRPDDAHLHYAMGAVLYTQGDLERAGTHLRESVRLQPDQLPSYYYLALVARDQGRDAEAIDTLGRLLERHPDHAAAHEALGTLLMTAQEYERAERHLRAAIDRDPQSVRAHYQLGLLLARVGRKDESEALLAHAKTLRQQDAEASRLQLRLLDVDR